MPGTLFLIPNALDTLSPEQSKATSNDAILSAIPETVLATTAVLDYFVAENAKSARAHLKRVAALHPLARPLQEIQIAELNVRTDASSLPGLLAPIMEGRNAGLISEAGLPAIADPGADLVRLAHQHGIPVKPLVGPSSLLLALMASGLNGQSLAFNGYLPTDAAQRTKRIRLLEERSRSEKQTQIFIETPYRNAALLEALAKTCTANTLICAATDLTLPTEAIITQSAGKWLENLKAGRMPDLQKKPTVFLFLAI